MAIDAALIQIFRETSKSIYAQLWTDKAVTPRHCKTARQWRSMTPIIEQNKPDPSRPSPSRAHLSIIYILSTGRAKSSLVTSRPISINGPPKPPNSSSNDTDHHTMYFHIMALALAQIVFPAPIPGGE